MAFSPVRAFGLLVTIITLRSAVFVYHLRLFLMTLKRTPAEELSKHSPKLDKIFGELLRERFSVHARSKNLTVYSYYWNISFFVRKSEPLANNQAATYVIDSRILVSAGIVSNGTNLATLLSYHRQKRYNCVMCQLTPMLPPIPA